MGGKLMTGRTGQVYMKKQGAQGAAASLVATDAVRHKNVTFTFDPSNKVNTDEKSASPGRSVDSRQSTRETAAWNLEALLRPSGTVGTLPDIDDLLECAFGGKTNPALVTTVASGGAVSGATLTSGAGLAINDGLLIVCPDGKPRLRRITAVNVGTGVVTWAPSLPTGQAPATGAAVKSAIKYQGTSALILALTISHYLKKADGSAGLTRQVWDAAVDKFSLSFDASNLPSIKASGFAKTMEEAQAQPGAFTTVGQNMPSGIAGELVVGSVFDLKFTKMAIDVANGMWARNESYGYRSQEEFFRAGYRDIAVGMDTRAGDASDEPYASAMADGTPVPIFKQTGFTPGSIIGLAMPNVEFKVPDTDDPDDVVNWPFKGMALESVKGANDDLILYFA